MPDADQGANAMALHLALVETLKQLNRAEEIEDEKNEGLEPSEILFLLRKGPLPVMSNAELEHAITTLVANRMAEPVDTPVYAWDRARWIGHRYVITLPGKEYLMTQIDKDGRIEPSAQPAVRRP